MPLSPAGAHGCGHPQLAAARPGEALGMERDARLCRHHKGTRREVAMTRGEMARLKPRRCGHPTGRKGTVLLGRNAAGPPLPQICAFFRNLNLRLGWQLQRQIKS
jgi:hypothetical protein